MIRILGAVLLLAACAGFGYTLTAAHRRERALLRQLIHALQEMEWELKYRLTELPDLCRIGADAAGGILAQIFREVAAKLDKAEVSDISASLNGIVSRHELPRRVRRNLKDLGHSLGRFDLEGQLQGLQMVRLQCRRDLQDLEQNSDQQLRNYQTLALCAGAALAILLI